ncbi:hypothetical protein FB45DRAFT_424774 [Roridomyces roridus]|uniref:F-box domain-containing protein n=1 Tax=Roridomyces roridus TaxID=1738132 RepID=A0AAD7C5J3_9AGAR|nr:hypothetical protein FB45DRAFT_424774 [Roridomyces roridus]
MSTADLRAELTQLDAQIRELKDALAAAESRRIAVHRQLREIATFPILVLPVEMTTQIFTHCLFTREEFLDRGRIPRNERPLQSHEPPLVFLAVCRAWREIALATPALWSAFRMLFDTIRVRRYTHPEPARIESYIHQWLGRAGQRPLSLTLGMQCYWYQNSVRDIYDKFLPLPRIRDIIHLYAPRIAYLELYCNPDQIRELALDTVPFPMLQHVCIKNDESVPSESVEVFSDAPQLTHLSLAYLAFPSSYVFPALQFTRFEGELNNLAIFALAPNLIEANCRPGEDCEFPSSPITHAHLQSLTLSRPCPYTILEPKDILPYLTLPELRTLDISAQNTTANPASISEFVHRSGARLLTLVLSVQGYKFEAQPEDVSGEWEECFRGLRNILEHLIVWPSEPFLKMILQNNIPILKSLTIHEAPQIPYELLCEGLGKRHSDLKSFRISFQEGGFLDELVFPKTSLENLPWRCTALHYFAQLAERGMSIQIDSGGTRSGKTTRVNLIGSS